MAAYFQSSLNHNLPIILNLDNSVTLTPENFPIVLSEQMNFGKSDQQENNFSLDDLCKAATSDLLANNNKAENSRSCLSMALCSNDFQFQPKNIVTGIITNIGLTGTEDVSPTSKHFSLKDKQNDKYKCEYCGKICAKPSILQKHRRSHTNERPYPCEECRVQFKTKSNLYKHCKSRSHLIQTSQTTDPKDAGDRTIEKLSPSTQTLVHNDKLDIQENTSSSCDCQEDVATRPQNSVVLVNQLGQVILKPLSHIGINSSTYNSATAPSLSPKSFNMECVAQFTNANCPRPLLKSLSEKGHSKAGHRVKPHSQSFSNEMEPKDIPKLDRAMTYDDIQRRISLIISLNETITDTPKEIKNHRIRKFVRDPSYGGNLSQNLCSGKLVTRSNSITPTLPNNDSFASFCQTTQSVGSKSPSFQHSTFISAPTSSDKQLWSLIPDKSSDSRPGLAIQNMQHFSLPSTGCHDVNEFRSLTKAHSFGNAQTILVSKSDSSLKTLNIASNQDLVRFFSEPNQEMIKSNTLEKGQFQMWSQSLDANFTHSPAVSPSSSPILSTSQRLKRGRPKGSKNKLKLSPVSSLNSIQPIIPSIHITSVDESPPPESRWRKELKRHLLKRSMSNENSADKDQTMPVTSTLQVSSSSSVNSFSTSCSGIQHLSPSSIPIKKRRKTLTELGRGTAFGTTVDDHNLDLNASSRPKTMTKPLWSSDGSFSKTVLSDESDAWDSKQIIQNSNKEICQNASENIPNDLKESNSTMQMFVNIPPAHNSCNSESLTKSTDNYAHVDMPMQPSDSNVAINLLKENHLYLPNHHSNQTAQTLQNSGNVVTKCQSESGVGHLLNNNSHSSPHLKFVLSHQSCTSDKISDNIDTSEKIADLIPVKPPGNQRSGIDQSFMHLKFKRFSQLEQTCDVRPKSSKSTEYNISNICGSNSASIESDVETGINNSSNYNLDECLLRARLDSEAAASLLDLSKSRLSPSVCDDLKSIKKYPSSISDAKSNYSNGTFISDVHVGTASSTDTVAVSPKNLHPLIASASLRDRHFFTNNVSKSYNFIEGKHICNICQKVFPKEHGLILHKNVHYMEKPHRCGKCQATFQSNWLLKRHQNIAHHLSKSLFDPRPFKCVECKVAFRTRGHLAKHARSKLHSQKLTSKSQHDKQLLDSNDVVDEVADDHEGEQFAGRSVVSFAPENNSQVLSHSPTKHHLDDFLVESSAQSLGNTSQCQDSGVYNVIDHKVDGDGIQEMIADSFSISEAMFKKISWMEKSRHYYNTKDIYNSCNQNFIDQESQPTERGDGAKSCQSNNSDHQVLPSTGNRMTSIQDHHLVNCHVCSAAFEDIYLLLQHYKSHLEQRVHVCRICDAGFKSSENLDAHMSSHSEKLQNSLGIQTSEDRICDHFQCESFAKNVLLKVVTTSHDETLEILKDNNMPVAHLPTIGASNCCLTRESSIFSNLSQKCIMSSGQWSTHSSGFHHLPSPSLQHLTNYIMRCPGETELDAPDRIKKSIADGIVINNQPSHLLLQPITSNNISLVPKNTLFLVPSETNIGDTSPNPGEILLYNPSAGCYIMAAGGSLVGLTSSVDKSLTIPVGSKPL